jgi:hypothetical protein
LGTEPRVVSFELVPLGLDSAVVGFELASLASERVIICVYLGTIIPQDPANVTVFAGQDIFIFVSAGKDVFVVIVTSVEVFGVIKDISCIECLFDFVRDLGSIILLDLQREQLGGRAQSERCAGSSESIHCLSVGDGRGSRHWGS